MSVYQFEFEQGTACKTACMSMQAKHLMLVKEAHGNRMLHSQALVGLYDKAPVKYSGNSRTNPINEI